MEGGFYLFVLVIMGVIFGLFSANIASTKGRSSTAGFFTGFFLGIIGIIIMALLSPINKQREQINDIERGTTPEDSNPSNISCKKCGYKMKSNSKFCPNCGEKVVFL